MRRTGFLATALCLALAASFFPARSARADVLSACGNLDATASSNCMLVTSGGCTGMCTPVDLEASCAAQLETTCSGGCTATADVNCTGNCEASCAGMCDVNPGSFDCQGSCETDCDATCSGSCSSDANSSQCEASCQASCANQCNIQCTATAPSATCTDKCQASCSGSCTAQANMSCDVSCQANGYANCTAMLQGGCTAQCSQPMGALFCDGQYVNVTSDVQSCVDQLQNSLNINVMVSSSASCSGNQCTAKASVSCDVSNERAPLPGGLLALALGALGVAVARRRR